MIKPDGVQRGLVAPILDRFLSKVRSFMGEVSVLRRRMGLA